MSWKDTLKQAAILFVKEVEKQAATNGELVCAACSCLRSKHCGCGMHCFGGAGTEPCGCQGFAPKATT